MPYAAGAVVVAVAAGGLALAPRPGFGGSAGAASTSETVAGEEH
jgi:hypothetical protein